MKFIAAMLIPAIGAFYSISALAARVDSMNTIWFDSNNNVIGQNAYFCNNTHIFGGAQTGAYKLVIKGGCGDPILSCQHILVDGSTQQTGTECVTVGYHRTVSQKLFGNFGSVTLQTVCDITQACTFEEPELMTQWGFPLGS